MSHVYLATKTKDAINAQMKSDGGARFRHFEGQIIPTLGDAFDSGNDKFRSHMGASLIADDCDRKIWYGWKWATHIPHEGRQLRLFNRGHLEEGRVIAQLNAIGATVWQQDENGKQFRISEYNGHFGGSGDGVGKDIPDLPQGMPFVLEIKTHNDKNFKLMVKSGVRLAKPMHYGQMQVYMRKMNLEVALYFAVNKNDDEIYLEIVPLDTNVGDFYLTRAGAILIHSEPPKKIGNSAASFKCKWCDHIPVCHLGKLPEMNCRSCFYSRPIREDNNNGEWECVNTSCTNSGRERVILGKAKQLEGCEHYERGY